MELSCYVHPWQRAYVYIFDHPYATITDEEGKFVLKDVPPGTYAIRVWHEALGVDEIKDVKVEGSKASIIRLKYTHEVKLE
ncbi:MAG TPA: carboxypeptidase-like regulatory domain-containing protein, partial [Nitrospirota bacterium]